MQLNLLVYLEEIIKLQNKFNKTQDPIERYAIIQVINSIAENDIPIHGYWEKIYKDAMIKKIKGEEIGIQKGLL